MTHGGEDGETLERRWRCPVCGGGWCRCRGCGERYAISASLACSTPIHYGGAPELACRCGAVVADGSARSRAGVALPLICDVARRPAGLIGRLRAREHGRTRFAWLSRGTQRTTSAARRREASLAGRVAEAESDDADALSRS